MWSELSRGQARATKTSLPRLMFNSRRGRDGEPYLPNYRLAGNFTQAKDFIEFLFVYTTRLRRQSLPRYRVRLHVLGADGTRSVRFIKNAKRRAGLVKPHLVVNDTHEHLQ